MKSLFKVVLLSAVLCAPVHADFSGDYAFGFWALAENGGSIFNGGANLVSLTSANGGAFANTDFTFTALEDLTVSFDWDYSTSDFVPFWDPFGYLLAGAFTRLTLNFGPDDQNGTATFSVLTGEVFGFRANTRDGLFGAATTDITNFSAVSAVPLPSSVSLLSCAIGGIILTQRRRPRNVPEPVRNS